MSDLWSILETCGVDDVISKRNKLWKRLRDCLKIRNVSNLYLFCSEQPPQYLRPVGWTMLFQSEMSSGKDCEIV